MRYLPPEIGCLKYLEHLDLLFNKMKSLLAEITYLDALMTLRVSSNKLVKLPSGLTSLQSLEDLDLSNNRLTSLECLELGSMHRLRKLNLQRARQERLNYSRKRKGDEPAEALAQNAAGKGEPCKLAECGSDSLADDSSDILAGDVDDKEILTGESACGNLLVEDEFSSKDVGNCSSVALVSIEIHKGGENYCIEHGAALHSLSDAISTNPPHTSFKCCTVHPSMHLWAVLYNTLM